MSIHLNNDGSLFKGFVSIIRVMFLYYRIMTPFGDLSLDLKNISQGNQKFIQFIKLVNVAKFISFSKLMPKTFIFDCRRKPLFLTQAGNLYFLTPAENLYF